MRFAFLRGLFGSEEVPNTRILICSVGHSEQQAESDYSLYSQFYTRIKRLPVSFMHEVVEEISKGYDVVHLLCRASGTGMLIDETGETIAGTELLQTCSRSNVKLIFFALDNPLDGYMKDFKASKKNLNVVMTVRRKGNKFSDFLKQFLTLIASGQTIPVAWARLVPQAPGPWQEQFPDLLLFTGRSRVKLLP